MLFRFLSLLTLKATATALLDDEAVAMLQHKKSADIVGQDCKQGPGKCVHTTTAPEVKKRVVTAPPRPTTTTAAPTTTLPDKPKVEAAMGVCDVMGDPHIGTFDREDKNKAKLHFYNEGDYWLVNSEDLKIQARYERAHQLGKNTRSWAQDVIISRAGTDDKILIGTSLPENTFSFNDASDSVASGSSKALGDFATVELTQERAYSKKHRKWYTYGKYMFSITGTDSEIEVVRSKYGLHIIISMPQQATSGHCGDFNGDADDDVADESAAVSASDLMFGQKTFAAKSTFTCGRADLAAAKTACEEAYATCTDRVQSAKMRSAAGMVAKTRLASDVTNCAIDHCGTDLDVEPDCDDDAGKFVQKAQAFNQKFHFQAKKTTWTRTWTQKRTHGKKWCGPKTNALAGRYRQWCKENGEKGHCSPQFCKWEQR